jgi:leucyl aminopeptidase
VDEYVEMLKSDVADIDNSGKSPNAGSITAALFLREFVGEGIKWAHLDIAGTSFINRQWKYFSPGSTGVGVRTFVEFVSRIEE